MTFAQVIEAARPIISAVAVPVSFDLESGYGKLPADLIMGLLDAGGVGLKLEDTVHSEGGRVRSTDEHATYLADLRTAATEAGVPVWINGRTDLFMHADDPEAVLEPAIERVRAMVEAGSNSVYPVKVQDSDELITVLVNAVNVPVNTAAHPVDHDLDRPRPLPLAAQHGLS